VNVPLSLRNINIFLHKILYVYTQLIVDTFPFRTWLKIPSLIQLSELWSCIIRILISHFLTHATDHHVWWTGFKLSKDSTLSGNKSAKNCTAEGWRNISFSEGKLGECSMLLCTKSNFIVLFTGFMWPQKLSILWQVCVTQHFPLSQFYEYSCTHWKGLACLYCGLLLTLWIQSSSK
jgi:hypothetical protein